MTINERLLDKRTIDRNIDKGLVKKDDVQKFLKDLPDLSNDMEYSSVYDDDDDDDKLDDDDLDDDEE